MSNASCPCCDTLTASPPPSPAEVSSLLFGATKALANGAVCYTRQYRSAAVAKDLAKRAFGHSKLYTCHTITLSCGAAVLVVDFQK